MGDQWYNKVSFEDKDSDDPMRNFWEFGETSFRAVSECTGPSSMVTTLVAAAAMVPQSRPGPEMQGQQSSGGAAITQSSPQAASQSWRREGDDRQQTNQGQSGQFFSGGQGFRGRGRGGGGRGFSNRFEHVPRGQREFQPADQHQNKSDAQERQNEFASNFGGRGRGFVPNPRCEFCAANGFLAQVKPHSYAECLIRPRTEAERASGGSAGSGQAASRQSAPAGSAAGEVNLRPSAPYAQQQSSQPSQTTRQAPPDESGSARAFYGVVNPEFEGDFTMNGNFGEGPEERWEDVPGDDYLAPEGVIAQDKSRALVVKDSGGEFFGVSIFSSSLNDTVPFEQSDTEPTSGDDFLAPELLRTPSPEQVSKPLATLQKKKRGTKGTRYVQDLRRAPVTTSGSSVKPEVAIREVKDRLPGGPSFDGALGVAFLIANVSSELVTGPEDTMISRFPKWAKTQQNISFAKWQETAPIYAAVEEIPGDGDCLFTALGVIREVVIQWILEHPERPITPAHTVADVIKSDVGIDIRSEQGKKDYIRRVFDPEDRIVFWGGDGMGLLLANYSRQHICVLGLSSETSNNRQVVSFRNCWPCFVADENTPIVYLYHGQVDPQHPLVLDVLFTVGGVEEFGSQGTHFDRLHVVQELSDPLGRNIVEMDFSNVFRDHHTRATADPHLFVGVIRSDSGDSEKSSGSESSTSASPVPPELGDLILSSDDEIATDRDRAMPASETYASQQMTFAAPNMSMVQEGGTTIDSAPVLSASVATSATFETDRSSVAIENARARSSSDKVPVGCVGSVSEDAVQDTVRGLNGRKVRTQSVPRRVILLLELARSRNFCLQGVFCLQVVMLTPSGSLPLGAV
mmetsp:Transcript_17254/g.47420  ORF Transcript_17254/g.47420 Transcript_17254/m.47420 type:complete len:856 (+) Transcript_17254:980-3547(+)